VLTYFPASTLWHRNIEFRYGGKHRGNGTLTYSPSLNLNNTLIWDENEGKYIGWKSCYPRLDKLIKWRLQTIIKFESVVYQRKRNL